jgi:ATP-binding cassette, subfamily B, multidrug efflux pump
MNYVRERRKTKRDAIKDDWRALILQAREEDAQVDDISGSTLQRSVYTRLFPYLRPHLGIFIFCSFLVLSGTFISLFSPRLLGMIVDKALVPKNTGLLWRFTFLYLGLECVRLTFLFTQSYLLQKIGQDVMQSVRLDLFGRLMRMPVTFFDKNPVGRLVTRVTNDTTNLAELFSAGFVVLLGDVLIIAGVIIAVASMHWKLGLMGISVFPIMLFFMYYFANLLRGAFRRSRATLSRLNGFFAEQMAGMPVVQLMGREQFERDNYRRISEEYRNHQFSGVNLYSLFHPAITFLSAVSMAFVIWYGAKYIQMEEIALGTYVSFLAYIQILYQPVRNITDRYNVFLAAMSSAERIFTLIDMPEEEGLRAEKSEVRNIRGELEFDNVSFSYDESPKEHAPIWALKNISFKIRAGENIAIVGHTGAGKTTILSLLFRFYDVKHGRVLLDGVSLDQYPKQELRERIGFVQQDVFLFAGTIRENLTLLRQKITDEEIWEAARATGFDRVLLRQEKGLDTILDERGSNLSLGERQILAFTRVFIQRPDILVLDEATSSVDRESELRIQAATNKLISGRTSIIIAHRLSTIRSADRIFVFEKGNLIEVGNHEQLVEHGGIYAKLVSLQESSTGAHNTSSM